MEDNNENNRASKKRKNGNRRRRRKKRSGKGVIIVAVIIIAAVCAVGFTEKHFFENKKSAVNNTADTGNSSSEGKADTASAVSGGSGDDTGTGTSETHLLAGIEKGKKAQLDYIIHKPAENDSTVILPSSKYCPKNRTQTVKTMAGYNPLNLKAVKGSYNDIKGFEGNPTVNRQFTSIYMIMFSLADDSVVAERDPDKVINPASMTKILTVLTAADLVKDLKADVPITQDILDYVSSNGASAVGFRKGDRIKVRDLFYGTILPSGADAAIALAKYCAGNEETFVTAMNEKARELGLTKTAHFTNMTGIYDRNHHCTVRDMAVILSAAVQNPFVKKVLSAHTRTIRAVNRKKHVYYVSNLFLRRIEDHPSGGTVVAAKTGFVNESGCCAASYYVSDSGNEYICVTDNTYSSWRAIYDHVAAYRSFAVN